MNVDSQKQIEKMKVVTSAVLINQCEKNDYEEFPTKKGKVRAFSLNEKGVGLSRNRALEHAEGEILLFSDDDIIYFDGYENIIENEFKNHPEADGLFFNLNVCEERRTYFNTEYGKCHIWNAGRYPAYSIAIKKEAIEGKNLKFSTLFGGGAKYACGEDSIFIKDLLKSGVKMYKTPAVIGEEIKRPSTWFKGYDEKFFFDRGVMYHYLYGSLAAIMGARFVFTKKAEMCKDIPPKKAYSLLLDGIKQGKIEKKN